MTSLRAPRRPLARWRAVVLVLVVLNVTIGLLVSVLALRHEADQDRQARVQLAELDAAAINLTRELLVCAAGGRTSGCESLAEARGYVVSATDSVAELADDPGDLKRIRAVVAAAPDVSTVAAGGNLTAGNDVVRRWLIDLHDVTSAVSGSEARDATTNGRLADIETVLLLVAALVVSVTLFRRFDSSRREGQLRTLAARARTEARFRALVTHASDVVLVLGDRGEILFRSPSAERVLGIEGPAEDRAPGVHPDREPDRLEGFVLAEDLPGLLSAIESLLEGERGEVRHQARWHGRNGGVIHLDAVLSDLRGNPDVRGVVLNGHDVTAARTFEEQLRRQAFTDGLTGLANRALFADRLQQALLLRGRSAVPPAVVALDLDAFRLVNEAGGHDEGDETLRRVARCLTEVARTGDTVARVGGDSFVVLLQPAGADEAGRGTGRAADADVDDDVATALAHSVGERLLAALRRIGVRASLGIAVLTDEVTEAEALMRRATLAMHAAKGRGGDCADSFDRWRHAAALEQAELRTDLGGAVARDELRAYYQPAVDVGTGELVGVEALLRWQHPERGMVSPATFVPVAEETGDVVELGRWILRAACAQARAWQQRYPRRNPLYVSVNVSVRQLEEPGLVEEVRATLAETRLPPSSLTLEITETQVIGDQQAAVAVLERLRELGCKVAIDDFGTGYSSLSYLERLPVDVLKIDRSFVQRMLGSEDARVLVGSIVSMARGLGLGLVAEGVEDPAQATMLARLDCPVAQGFLWAKPLTAAKVAALLEAGGRITPSTQVPGAEPSVPAPRGEVTPRTGRTAVR